LFSFLTKQNEWITGRKKFRFERLLFLFFFSLSLYRNSIEWDVCNSIIYYYSSRRHWQSVEQAVNFACNYFAKKKKISIVFLFWVRIYGCRFAFFDYLFVAISTCKCRLIGMDEFCNWFYLEFILVTSQSTEMEFSKQNTKS
jgi:hypothetical protein